MKMSWVLLALCYALRVAFMSYATYVAIVSCVLGLVFGKKRYFLKRNQIYDMHSIMISRFRLFGRKVIKSSIIKEHDVPKTIVGYSVAFLVGLTIRLQYPRFWAFSGMYPEVELFWYIAIIIMMAYICGFFSAEVYEWSANKKKGELKHKII